MGRVVKSSVNNYIEVPADSVIEMAGQGLKTESQENAPPKLTIDAGEGLEVNAGQLRLDLRRHENHDQFRVLTNIHHNMDENFLVIEKVFTTFEIVKTWFGLFVDLVVVGVNSVFDRVEVRPIGGYRAIIDIPSRSSTAEEPNFYQEPAVLLDTVVAPEIMCDGFDMPVTQPELKE